MIRYIFLIATLISSPTWAQDTKTMKIGEQAIFQFENDLLSVKASKSGIVELTPSRDKRSLQIGALRAGSTVVTARTRNGNPKVININVNSTRQSRAAILASLRARINEISGLTARLRKNKVEVTGIIASRQTADQFFSVLASNREYVTDRTQKRYRDSGIVADAINSILEQNDIPNLKVRAIGKLLALQGFSKDANESALALKIARLIDPSVEDQIEDSQYNGGHSVVVDVMFLESNRTDNLDFGFLGQSPAVAADGVNIGRLDFAGSTGSVGGTNGFWAVAPLRSMINLLQAKSNTKVMSNPKIVVRSGTEAKFHSGGVVYLFSREAQTNNDGNTQVFETKLFPIEYGMVLDVRPKVDPLGQIDIVLTAEVSEFVPGQGDINPGTTLSKTSTAVTIKDGHSVLLTGFKNVRKSKATNRIPFLGHIPTIGELFKARKMGDERRDLMVLLTAKISRVHTDHIKAFSQLKQKTLPNEVKVLEQMSEDSIKFSIFD
ncbi:MAG: hypothetical protein HRU19_08735 [Pseudobacteriovorax sp.]|nr:hypothetical protein [Pseudobacteriovorax sp.]